MVFIALIKALNYAKKSQFWIKLNKNAKIFKKTGIWTSKNLLYD